MRIYFLGAGNMGAALIQAFQKIDSTEIIAVSRSDERRRWLQSEYTVSTLCALPELTARDTVILAVKPKDMQSACADLKLNGALAISVAAGLSVDTLSHYLNGHRRIIRAMPNTPAALGQGVTGLYAPPDASQADRDLAAKLFSQAGMTLWLPEEIQMHAITAIAGSGSGYVFYLMNALQEAALNLGFDDAAARALAVATFSGAVALAQASNQPLLALQHQVTSKAGTTEAAIMRFEEGGVADHLVAGAEACLARSVEIAQMFEA